MKRYIFIFTLSLCTSINAKESFRDSLIAVFSQSPEMAGSVYRAYPSPSQSDLRVPDSYRPIYISHYGRHGSRWLTEDSRYQNLIKVFQENKLTDEGKELYHEILEAWKDAELRSGELTPIGNAQHKAIAERMVLNYPTLFNDSTTIRSVSSTSRRCMMSMMAFCERLKEMNPSLRITRSADERGMRFINFESTDLKEFNKKNANWRKLYQEFQRKNIDTTSITRRFFANHAKLSCNALWLSEELYWLAEDIQNTVLNGKVNMLRHFRAEELYSIWRCINLRMYIANSSSSISWNIPAQSSFNLLHDIIDKAEESLTGKSGFKIDLRFGHDSALLRLLALIGAEGCSDVIDDFNAVEKHWRDYSISPMAANLQIVFYSNDKDEILVRFLLNEKPIKLSIKPISGYNCLYEWEHARSYLYYRMRVLGDENSDLRR